METEKAKFKGYLVREFFWKLAQHYPLPRSFAGVQQETVGVFTFSGYDDGDSSSKLAGLRFVFV